MDLTSYPSLQYSVTVYAESSNVPYKLIITLNGKSIFKPIQSHKFSQAIISSFDQKLFKARALHQVSDRKAQPSLICT